VGIVERAAEVEEVVVKTTAEQFGGGRRVEDAPQT